MLFNSLQFALFFPIVTLLYFSVPHRARWPILLAASCAFYMAFIPVYILVLFATIVIDYVAAIKIEESSGAKRKHFLVISILSTCLVLFVFKYFNFFNANVEAIAKAVGWHYPIDALRLILPIGLSFHTFQSLSYVIEVYRGHQKAERHFGIYSLYVMFYPQLVAGPIERPQNLLHQFREVKRFDFSNLSSGLQLMAWGFFKKVVIADRLSVYVNAVYGDAHHYSGATLVLGTLAFAYQIYCDFSGYSDIAIGAARVMGFKLMRNFNSPYASRSIGEFWKRWHISLSTWFRDYVYFPLGGNRVSRSRLYFNLLITFLISGIWHGANWTFVIWGALNGFYLICGQATESLRNRFREWSGLARLPFFAAALRIGITLALTCIGWVFFRANSLADAGYILTHMLTGWHIVQPTVAAFSELDAIVVLGAIGILELVQWLERNAALTEKAQQWPTYVRWPAYYALLAALLVFGVFDRAQFIYFQF
jgi:alginate O-acetyltransferase complex protein AlgI